VILKSNPWLVAEDPGNDVVSAKRVVPQTFLGIKQFVGVSTSGPFEKRIVIVLLGAL
jgi:hypothetical protein